MPTVEIGRRGKSTERMCITVVVAGLYGEVVGAGNRVAVEQRAEVQDVVAGLRLEDPEGGKDREFLTGGAGCADGETAGGETVQGIVRHGAEVARALKHRHLVPDSRAIDRVAKAYAGKAHIGGEPGGRLAVRVREIVGVKGEKVGGEGDRLSDPTGDQVHLDLVLEVEARRHQIHLEAAAAVGEEPLFLSEADPAELVVLQLGERLSHLHERPAVRLGRDCARAGDHSVEAEADGRGVLGVSGGSQWRKPGADEPSEGGLQERAPVHFSFLKSHAGPPDPVHRPQGTGRQ